MLIYASLQINLHYRELGFLMRKVAGGCDRYLMYGLLRRHGQRPTSPPPLGYAQKPTHAQTSTGIAVKKPDKLFILYTPHVFFPQRNFMEGIGPPVAPIVCHSTCSCHKPL